MARSYVPETGDIVWLEFNPQAGHEQSGHRPALVISPSIYNSQTGLIHVKVKVKALLQIA
jgi:mRNA interferase MazF